MTEYDNTNSFVLFKNDKGDNPKRPDYTGSLDVGGTEYWISAWIREGKKGKFMSGQIKLKEERQAAGGQSGGFDDLDDDIPFASADASHDVNFKRSRKWR